MKWQNFIQKLEKDFRISGLELEKKTGIQRHIIYKIRKGITNKPRQNTIRKLEEGLNIKIDDSDPDNLLYSQNLFDKDIELFNIDGNSFPIVSGIERPSEIFIPQNIIGKITLPYSKKVNCFAIIVTNNHYKEMFSYNDKLLFDIDAKPENGSIVACRLKSGEQFIKYFRCLPEDLYQFYSPNVHEEPLSVKKNMIAAMYKAVLAIKNI
ncbi:MAG: S24 family peptidase [Clostridiales bacterium]